MPTRRRILGDIGEKLAREHLLRQGFVIKETNARTPLGEIDIVAQDGDCLVFVEVRTKRSDSFGSPEESLTRAKRQKLVALAEEYLQRFDEPPPCRIDVVAVELSRQGRVLRVELIRNAVDGEA
ncbi:MAG: YraN family protein [Chloroflexi bacterium]|nr:YraN family protein [Chloroflexota bacterium]